MEEVALKAALNSIRYKLPMADSLIYVTGQVEGAIVWIQDEHFENLPGVNYKKVFLQGE